MDSATLVAHMGVMERVALRLTRSRADAADLVQDSCIRALRGSYDATKASPRAWLATIIRNTWRNTIRSRTRRAGYEKGAPACGEMPGTDTGVMEADAREMVERLLWEVPGCQAAAIRLVDLQGLTYAQAAAQLACPIGSIMSRLHRGRKAMAQAAGCAS